MMKCLVFLRFSLLALALLTGTATGAQAVGVQQAFLVQNSGWMEPFYTAPGSSFKPLVAAVAQAAASADDAVSVLAFSQSSSRNVSPVLLTQTTGGNIGAVLKSLEVARKSDTALADTDFKEAVTKTITDVFKAKPGIVWIFTNNRNSPGNDPATSERNREFYRLLHQEPAIVKSVVFPIRMPLKGRQYEARGMMIYALAYGQPAAQALDRILAEGRLSKVLTAPPARLKPIDSDALTILPESVDNTPDLHPSLGSDGRTLVLDVDADKYVPGVTLKASLQNRFFPYAIQSARLEASLNKDGRATPVAVAPAEVVQLRPGARQAVTVRFNLPFDKVPSAWSLEALLAMGKQMLIPMQVDLGLRDQVLVLDEDFKAQMRDLFPGDPISDVLVPPADVKQSLARVPLLLRVQYPLWPVVMVSVLLLLLAVVVAAVGLLWGKSSRYSLQVNGLRRNVMLKAFSSAQVRDEHGEVIATVKRGFGKPVVNDIVEGHSVRVV
jgi:hypothetical protein